MEEPKEGMISNHGKKLFNPFAVSKAKKRSLVERELETNMTARITSPITIVGGATTSRYGRARRIKTGCDDRVLEVLKSAKSENIPVKTPSVAKQVVNPSYKTETPKKALETSLHNIDNKTPSCTIKELPKSQSAKTSAKAYIRKDLIQNRVDDDDDDDIILIKDLFSPKSSRKSRKLLKKSSEKLNRSFTKNVHVDNTSVVKTLDFGSKSDSAGIKRFFDGNKSDSTGIKRYFDGNKLDSAGNKSNLTSNKRNIDGNKVDSTDNKISLASSKINFDGKKQDFATVKSDSINTKIYFDGNKHNGGNKNNGGNKSNLTSNKMNFDGNKLDTLGIKSNLSSNKINCDGNKQRSDNKRDSKKKKDVAQSVFKNQLSKLEEMSPYQAGDLAWARMGTFPFWPCIITRDPESDMFVRKKLFGRVEHYILHVTFFADNGRRSWVVDNMLRKYMGLKEFITTREKFTNEDKKNNPRLYSAFFISEKKQSLWNSSVAEAEIIDREPINLRIDVFSDILYRTRASKKQLRSGKITRTDSDVSLSESLFDSLFSENDSKADDLNRLKNRSRNRSLDVSDVVTACLDNMAAKTGNIKIQKQSHMDRWLQKAKSKTPEKVKTGTEQDSPKTPVDVPKNEIVTPRKVTPNKDKIIPIKIEKPMSNNKKKKLPAKENKITKVYSLRRSYESQNALIKQSENEELQSEIKFKDLNVEEKLYSKSVNINKNISANGATKSNFKQFDSTDYFKEELADDTKDTVSNDNLKNSSNDNSEQQIRINTSKCSDEGSDDILNAINELLDDSASSNNKIHGLKPDAMDVDEKDDKQVSAVIEVFLESPIKVENESTIKDNPVSESNIAQIDCDSPIKTERESVETLQVTNDEVTELNSYVNVQKISPNFKQNEMVSIPENFDMTDDESNFMTSMENDVDVQDHNSNLTNVNAKTRIDDVDITLRETPPIEKSVELNISTEKLDMTTENQKFDTKTVDLNSRAIDSSCAEVTLVKELTESNICTTKHISVEKLDINTVEVTLKEMNSSCVEITPIEKHNTSIEKLNTVDVNQKEMDSSYELNQIKETVKSSMITEIQDIEKLDTDTPELTSKEITTNFIENNKVQPLESKNSIEESNMSIENLDTDTSKVNQEAPNKIGYKCTEINTIEEPVKMNMSIEEYDRTIEKLDTNTDKDLINEEHDMSVDEDDERMNEKDLLNVSGQSASILQIDDDISDFLSPKVINEPVGTVLDGSVKSESISKPCQNDEKELKCIEIKLNENITSFNKNTEPAIFLVESHNSDVYKDATSKDTYFRDVNISEPPDLSAENVSAKADLLSNAEDKTSDEDSDDEPSPEYEPLGDEITEDFRQHMKCIESSITDKKDDAQLVKVCNEIAIIEESKAKLADIKISMDKISSNVDVPNNTNSLKENQRIVEERQVIKGEIVKSEKVVCDEIGLTDTAHNITKDTKYDILDGLNIRSKTVENSLKSRDKTNYNLTKNDKISNHTDYEVIDGLSIIQKALENNLKSPTDKKKYKLSLKKNAPKHEIGTKQSVCNDDNFNPRYKTIDQIEEIMKNKPTRLPIENGEVRIPAIKENGYHRAIDTPDHYDDDDFDIDKVSVNSEDSEVSLPQEKIPARRSLRTRPKKGGLEDPEFLTYMELRQDDLMEQHPELSVDDIVLYLYKTYAYSQKLEADAIETEKVKSIKQETTPPQKKSKKITQPKNTIENFFRIKYKNAVDSEKSASLDSNEDVKPKRDTLSISPVDSGIGESKSAKRKTKSPQIDVTKEVKTELINDKHKHATSPKTPKRRNKVISPRNMNSKISPNSLENSLNKRGPFVVISPIKDGRIGMILKREIRTKPKFDIETKPEPGIEVENIIETKREPDAETEQEPVNTEKQTQFTEFKHEPCNENTQDIVTSSHDPSFVAKQELIETNHEPSIHTKQELIETDHEPITDVTKQDTKNVTDTKHKKSSETKHYPDTESLDSDSELPLRQLRTKVLRENQLHELKKELLDLKEEINETASTGSDNEPLLKPKPKKVDKSIEGSYEDPEFLTYLEQKQEYIMDENPQLSQNEIKAYLYKTWIYEKNSKSDIRKIDDIESSNLVKGLNHEPAPTRRPKRKPKTEKNIEFKVDEVLPKDKPKRKTVSHYYNEAFLSDIEDELEVFELFKTKKDPIILSKQLSPKKEITTNEDQMNEVDTSEEISTLDEIELYFKQLTTPKPSVFKGLIREKVCEICEDVANLIKCKVCHGTFHYDCVNKVVEVVETPTATKGRKKKKRNRKLKSLEDSDHSEEQDVSAENMSIEEVPESITIDAATLESQLEAKMKELLEKNSQLDYDSYSSDDGIDWTDTVPGKCELVDVKLKKRLPLTDYANFKCNNCQILDTPVCFVCKSAVSKTNQKIRQRCNVAHCHNYYHIECLDHWPQTQFNAGELSRSHKKGGQLPALTCPRHVCHTCVSDDPRGCKTRFCGDKLARCVRCPATYHSFNKCLPAGTQILTASLIICPRHYENRPGKVPCHVNTGWCFICALGGSLICCEYCPTSFHAECLNIIKPPEGSYMCEDCETGRLPLYGEMVWVKLGHYRWWPGVILHPSEIPENIMAVKHGLGEFVVRFFGQYDHYWVNRGRVFPYQEDDSGRVSSQKSKIDMDFTTAMEHAQRAFEILKTAVPDEEESSDIASSLLPPHYVKLKCNKPTGSLLGRKVEDPSLSLTQCECNPNEFEPCGPNSQCINRMLLTECGPTCRAGDRCSNRAFEKRLYPKLTPYKATHRGWGLKTLEDIKAGQFVIEYVGELLDEEEFQRRMARMHEIRDENFYFLALDKERMIDAGPKGNLARFMNHCCEPNCETQKWTVLGDIRVGLFAIDDIKANSEVTFNYNLECTGIEKKRCLCGAKRCSGYIGAKPKQLVDESQRKKNGTLTGKRKYTKRKNIVVSPGTVKKPKRPLGRPPKPKVELTELEKDLLIIKSATTNSIEESRTQSIEEKNLKPLKKKIDTNTREEGTLSTAESQSNQKLHTITPERNIDTKTKSEMILNGIESTQSKVDLSTKQVDTISSSTEPSKVLKRKLNLNPTEEVTISSEPSAKRQKCDKHIEVGD